MTDPRRADWRTMTADELTAYIRQLLGWKKHVYPQQRYAHNDWDGPDGDIHDCDLENCPPDPGNDADAALSLLSSLPVVATKWELGQQDINRLYVCQITQWDTIKRENVLYYCERADTPALAICRAWLAWKTAR